MPDRCLVEFYSTVSFSKKGLILIHLAGILYRRRRRRRRDYLHRPAKSREF